MGGNGVDAPVTVPYDSGIAFRISCEMPLVADLPTLAEPLTELTEATLAHAPPELLEALARHAVDDAWDDHLAEWTRETLVRMRSEYELRLDYIHDALADVANRGGRALIAPHVARRLAERIALEVQLQADWFETLEDELASRATTASAALTEIGTHLGRRLDVPGAEVNALQRRAVGLVWRGGKANAVGRTRRRIARTLATEERRAQVRSFALELAHDLRDDAPILSGALATAAEGAPEPPPEDDPLWVGAVRGVLLQHDAWRLDGPHLNDVHPVFSPL